MPVLGVEYSIKDDTVAILAMISMAERYSRMSMSSKKGRVTSKEKSRISNGYFYIVQSSNCK